MKRGRGGLLTWAAKVKAQKRAAEKEEKEEQRAKQQEVAEGRAAAQVATTVGVSVCLFLSL